MIKIWTSSDQILIYDQDISPESCKVIEYYGYDKNKTFGEIVDLAIVNNCNIIIKNGYNGKWYLKGKNKEINFLQIKINENIGNSRDGVVCYLIE